MKLSLMERFGIIEVSSRIILGKFPKLKKIAKRIRANGSHGFSEGAAGEINPNLKIEYFEKIASILQQDDIVLIHSSMDGLESIGITAEDFMAFMKRQVSERGITFVLPCFPITNLKPPTEKSRPYDPKKTLCWTGMLPNMFIGDADVIRTTFPYNSLAAMGPKATPMMANDEKQISVYDENSAWHYLLENDAKILFAGVKASGSNTMGIHAQCDFMKEGWPVENWYETRTYKVRINGQVTEKTIKVQADHWYQYCMEERTSGRLKEAGVLVEDDSLGCNLGLIESSKAMVDVLTKLCNKGKLMYMIPKKYIRKR